MKKTLVLGFHFVTAGLVAADAIPNVPSYTLVAENLTTDEGITAAVQKALASDGNTAPYAGNIFVTTVNGMVTLSGTVNTEAAKYNAGVVAKTIVGQYNVVNNIYVKLYQ